MRASHSRRLLSRSFAGAALSGLLLTGALAGAAWAQTKAAPPPNIYTCTTPDGRRLTSDRPIAECQAREQRVLNSDGSVRKMLPPAMSPEEQSAFDQRKRMEEVQRAAQQDAIDQPARLVFAQCLGEHLANIAVGAHTKACLVANRLDELAHHLLDLCLLHVAHLRHRRPDLLDLLGSQMTQDLRGICLTQRKQENRGLVDLVQLVGGNSSITHLR